MAIHVKNKRTFRETGKNVVYVGRPTPLGNQFKLTEYSRPDSIARYETWLYDQLDSNAAVRMMLDHLFRLACEGDLYLTCWCTPLPCHADIIAELLETMLWEEEHESISYWEAT